MTQGRGGMGMHKHGISGRAGKSPAMRQHMKREAEKDERKDRSRIKDPKSTIEELFHPTHRRPK